MEGRRILAELTVEENLLAGGYASPRAHLKDDLDRYYTRFPILGERRRQAAGYLSGGEQQMLAIARALMSRPKVLLLDEPSLGLAPKIVQDVARLIRSIRDEDGVSILIVEQNASVALELADYGYILENGRVVLDGTADALKADPDIQEFYLGLGGEASSSYRDVKRYRRRKRWLS
jgi:branched-chain amino acid transport system ATP-binding protein